MQKLRRPAFVYSARGVPAFKKIADYRSRRQYLQPSTLPHFRRNGTLRPESQSRTERGQKTGRTVLRLLLKKPLCRGFCIFINCILILLYLFVLLLLRRQNCYQMPLRSFVLILYDIHHSRCHYNP